MKTDTYGAVFEVPLTDGATSLSYIIHKGDTKDLDADQSLDFSTYGHEVWLLNGTAKYLLPSTEGSAADLDLSAAKAQWIDRNTVAWDTSPTAAASYQLVYSPDGDLTLKDGALTGSQHWLRLTPVSGGLTDAQRTKYPHLKDYAAFTVDPRDRDRTGNALTGQVVATQHLATGALLAATGVQTQGVLDDLYAAKAGKASSARSSTTTAHRRCPSGPRPPGPSPWTWTAPPSP